MKKTLISCVSALVLALMTSPVFATQYSIDFLEPGNPGGWGTSLKTFDKEFTVTSGKTFCVDIWMENAGDKPDPCNGGFWIDFQIYTDLIEITEIQRYSSSYELPGPWTAGGFFVIGPSKTVPNGSAVATVANLSFAPKDADGDIIIARVEFHCKKAGNVDFTVTTVPSYCTWAPAPGPWNDDEILENFTTIHQADDNSGDTTTTTTLSASTSSTTPHIGPIRRFFRRIFRRD